MTAVARKQLPLRPAGPDTVDGPARLVRPRAARPAVAGGAGQARRSLPRLAQRDHAAADDGQGGHPLLPALPRALADGRGAGRGAARRRARRLGGARLLQPRAQPAQVRAAPSPSATAAGFRAPRPSCASCRASAPTRRRRSRPSPSASAATPVDGNIERVVARLFAVTPAAARRQAGAEAPRRHADAGAARRRFRAGDDGSRRQHLHAASAPRASMCPLQRDCAAHAQGIEARAAGAARKPERPAARRPRLPRAARGRRTCCCAGAPRPGCSAACWRCPRTEWADDCCRRRTRRCARRRCAADWWAVPGTVVPHLHALHGWS